MSAQAFGTALSNPQVDDAAATSAFDQRLNLCRSLEGTPSISAMIVVGSGSA